MTLQRTPISLLAIVVCIAFLSIHAFADYPFHENPDELVVTRGDTVLRKLPCERVVLDGGEGRWRSTGEYAYIRGQVGRTSDGTLYTWVGGAWGAYYIAESARNVMFASEDEGRTWPKQWNVDLPKKRMIGNFLVLSDDSFLASATEPGDDRVSFYRSTDRGLTWNEISQLKPGPFQKMYLDGNMLELQGGMILLPVIYSVPAPEGTDWKLDLGLQFMMRSTDRGKTWHNGPDPAVWKPLIDAKLTVAPVGPRSRIPGGTFPGCFETGLAQEQSGRLLAALRFSGAPWPWHESMKEAWGGREADGVGRIFRQVMFSTSTDGGLNWEMMRPFADADGESVIIQQETNGQLLPLPDGRIVLIHQRRFGPFQLIGRVSPDGGKTWLHDEFRLMAGFGYSGNLLLDDGTVVTACGHSLDGKHRAMVMRWRVPSK